MRAAWPLGIRPRRVASLFAPVFLLLFCWPTSGQGGARPNRDSEPAGRYLEETVYEGVGFAGVEFGDTAEEVEEIMGEAGGGSEHSLRYMDSGMEVRLCNGKVRGFTFYRGFRGKLFTGGLGIGDSLDDVQEAYGEILKERRVNELTDWMLDRTLLIRRGGPKYKNGAASRLYYYDAGIYIFFNEEDRICGFSVYRKTGFADRSNGGGSGQHR